MSASYKILRAIARVYSKLVYRVEYHGRENEPQSGEYIAISNHSSFADVMFTACPLKGRYTLSQRAACGRIPSCA